MTKEESFNAAEKLLMNIYNGHMEVCARVCTAVANKDKDYLTGSLDEIIKFCEEIKKGMWEE